MLPLLPELERVAAEPERLALLPERALLTERALPAEERTADVLPRDEAERVAGTALLAEEAPERDFAKERVADPERTAEDERTLREAVRPTALVRAPERKAEAFCLRRGTLTSGRLW